MIYLFNCQFLKLNFLTVLFLSFFIVGCQTENKEPSTQSTTASSIALQPIFTNLTFDVPIAMLQSSNGQWFVVEQNGKIKTFKTGDTSTNTFIDLAEKVDFGGEKGLLGMALHPEFHSNGIFFVSYSNNSGNSNLSRFQSNNLVVDANSEKTILTVDQPYSNHNGGQITFGPDGFLYFGLGDGGAADDPRGHGQNKETLLGSIIRIDVNNSDTYEIPADNPFVGKPGKDEIYAYGLRNPWRWSFDKKTGELWLADVGQNEWEEINIIKLGGNYGWNSLEANHCFVESNCDKSGFISPIFEYSHNEGRSVTGGYVYRGTEMPNLNGHYFYADYVSGNIWSLRKNADSNYTNTLRISSNIHIASFAEDLQANLYVIAHQSGKIFKIIEKIETP